MHSRKPSLSKIFNISAFTNSTLLHRYIDNVLKLELGRMYSGLPDFYDKFFGGVAGLEEASAAFFEQCQTEGHNPRFDGSWQDWPLATSEGPRAELALLLL